MSNRIIGLDIGSHTIKLVVLDARSSIEFIDEERVVDIEELSFDDLRPGSESDMQGLQGSEWEDGENTQTFQRDGAEVEAALADEEEATLEQAAPAPVEDVATDIWPITLRQLMMRFDTDGEWITAMPDQLAMTIHVELPFAERQKVQSVLPHMLTDRLPIDPKKVAWDFDVYTRKDGVHEAIVGFVRSEDLGYVLEQLQDVRADPSVMMISELVLAQVAAEISEQKQEIPIAVVDIGHRYTRVVVSEGDRPLLARTVMRGGEKIDKSIARSFGVDEEEAQTIKEKYATILDADAPNEEMLRMHEAVVKAVSPIAREVRRSLQGLFARTGTEVGMVYICGGTSRVRGIGRYLSAQLGVEVQKLEVPEIGAGSETKVLAYALANANTRKTVDLRQGPYTFRGKSSVYRRRLVQLTAAAAALCIIIFATLLLQRQAQIAERDALLSALRTQTTELFGQPVAGRAEIMRRFEGEGGGALAFIPRTSAYEWMHNLVENMSEEIEVELSRLEVDIERNVIQLNGRTTDAQAVDRLVSSLERIDCLRGQIRKDRVVMRGEQAEFELQISTVCN